LAGEFEDIGLRAPLGREISGIVRVAGSVGTFTFRWPSWSAAVRSPTAERRHDERFGALTLKRSSMKRNCEVWSKVSEQMAPPRLNGEMTRRGTRKPRPIGPSMPRASAGRGSTDRYSPSVPGGATGGSTWSKNPSFSSYMWNRTVLDQTSVLARRAWRTWSVNHSPRNGGAGGCSS